MAAIAFAHDASVVSTHVKKTRAPTGVKCIVLAAQVAFKRVSGHVTRPVALRVLIDSGASHNIISRDLVEALREMDAAQPITAICGMGFEGSSRIAEHMVVVDVAVAPVAGDLVMPTYPLHDVELYVFPIRRSATYDIILGMPWLQRANASIDFATGILAFPPANAAGGSAFNAFPGCDHPVALKAAAADLAKKLAASTAAEKMQRARADTYKTRLDAAQVVHTALHGTIQDLSNRARAAAVPVAIQHHVVRLAKERDMAREALNIAHDTDAARKLQLGEFVKGYVASRTAEALLQARVQDYKRRLLLEQQRTAIAQRQVKRQRSATPTTRQATTSSQMRRRVQFAPQVQLLR